jgi:rhodanese-related sulfurtransferase
MKNKSAHSFLLAFVILAGATITSCGSSTVSKATQETIQPLVSSKSIVVDVRTVEEWNGYGHSDCSINIPLPELESRMKELKGYDKVVLVCRSGNRAGKAKDLLEASGFRQVENLGAWQNIKCP